MDSYFEDKALHSLVTKARLHRMNNEIIDHLFNHNALNMRLMLIKNAANVGKIENWKPYKIDQNWKF